MAIQKNFVVKNGIEVNDNLIFADKDQNTVGIGTTITPEKLQVSGGIGATSIVLTGVGTIPTLKGTTLNYTTGNIVTGVITSLSGTTLNYSTGNIITGVITSLSGSTLNYSGIATAGSYRVGNTEVISSSRELKNIISLDSVTTATIESAIANAPNTFSDLVVTGISTLGVTSATSLTSQNLNVSGVSTLGTLKVVSGIVTATSGIVTYYGDGQYLNLAENPDMGIGIATAGGTVGTGATILDFRGPGISTVTVSAGIATINITGGGGGGGAVSIGTTAPPTPTNGDLWYSPDYARTFVWYDEVALGIGSTAVWVDAAPFNINLSQLDDLQVNSLVVVNHTDLNTLDVSGISTLSSLNVTNNITSGTLNVSGISTLGNVVSSGIITAVDFNSTSDENLKYNVETVDNALDTVNSLRGVKFQWKEDDRTSYGVIAQELEVVLPDLVSSGDIKTVNYNGIIGVLIEAIKELKAEVEDLKNSK
jgi:hypothetical protein